MGSALISSGTRAPEGFLKSCKEGPTDPERIFSAILNHSKFTVLYFLGKSTFTSSHETNEVLKAIQIHIETIETSFPNLFNYHCIYHSLNPDHFIKKEIVLEGVKEWEDPSGEVHNKYGVGYKPSIVIVRPDGYVGMSEDIEHSSQINSWLTFFLSS